jgi:hypothetical protein
LPSLLTLLLHKTLDIPAECLAECQRSALPKNLDHFHSGAVLGALCHCVLSRLGPKKALSPRDGVVSCDGGES